MTGDRALRDADGFFHFADRAKDMLKVGGENESSAEIERVIVAVPGVREVAVVSRPDPLLDEVPIAFVLAADSGDPTLTARILTACGKSLASFKTPREVRALQEFPRATLEKVSKVNLRAMLGEVR